MTNKNIVNNTKFKKGDIRLMGENNPSKRQEVRKKISESKKLAWKNPLSIYRTKVESLLRNRAINNPPMKGKKRLKHSERMKGRNNPFYGKIHTEETQKKIIRKSLRRRGKSLLELKFEGIINELNLPYKFVGNGEFLIGRKCPDFININGEKIAIEVYYRRHKKFFRGDIKLWKQNREKIFSEYGWKLLFFNELEVNKDKIIQKIGGGQN